jgi:predicted Fe-Mo cluster-binding NifX family protein
MKFNVVFATDDGKIFMDRHFGDSKYYDLYEISEIDSKFVKRIINTTEEDNEEIHADPKKAKGVSQLFKNENIKVLVSKVFGPNIKRINTKFVCVLMNDKTIQEGISKIQKQLNILEKEWEKGEERNYLNIKDRTEGLTVN